MKINAGVETSCFHTNTLHVLYMKSIKWPLNGENVSAQPWKYEMYFCIWYWGVYNSEIKNSEYTSLTDSHAHPSTQFDAW